MFTLKKISNENTLLEYLHLSNEKVSCKIFPNLGASLQQFSIENTEFIEGIESNETELEYYRRYYPSSFLFPFPGRIAGGNYDYNGKEHQLLTNEGGRDNAIHGFIAEASFKLISQELTISNAKLVFGYAFKGQEGFPFPADLNITYHILETGLSIDFQITNTGTNSFPFGLGWHPYFLAKNLSEAVLDFESDEQLTADENQIPNGSEPIQFQPKIGNQELDDTYLLLDSKIRFSTSEYNMTMETFSTDKNFLQLYIPPNRNSIAIEPMTCAPDVFNLKNGLLELAPNETYEWSIQLDFTIK